MFRPGVSKLKAVFSVVSGPLTGLAKLGRSLKKLGSNSQVVKQLLKALMKKNQILIYKSKKKYIVTSTK